MEKIEKIFTDKFTNNSWKGTESKSGPGSSLVVNQKLLLLLNQFCEENKIKKILDCGCGDFNWMREFDFNLIDSYLGIDIVEQLIEENKVKFQSDKIKFSKINLVSNYIPDDFDAIICKDVLFHLSFEEALVVLNNMKNSNSKFLLSTTFYDVENKNVKTGDWRPINLETEPFNLGSPIFIWKNIEDKKTGFLNKSIGIWKLNK